MKKQTIKSKNKKTIFLCQITENYLKLIKCLSAQSSHRELLDLEFETLPVGVDDKQLCEKLSQVLKKIGYSRGPVIISLPRNQATCRYIKVPEQTPEEIEKIIAWQASRYLPYPTQELITGYQIISTDKEGYTYLNLIIIHRDVIERYFKILAATNIQDFIITLNSYGLCNLLNRIYPQESAPCMIVDIDLPQIEIAIASQDKLLFSRSFKISQQEKNWQSLFLEEINLTKDAYSKEVANREPNKIIIAGSPGNSNKFKEILMQQTTLPVETLPYWEHIPASERFLNRILNTDGSCASLAGLGLKNIPESLNLLPEDAKQKRKKVFLDKERLKLALLTFGAILVMSLAVLKHLDNKARYLAQLKLELNKISFDAKSLEELEKRFKFLESRLQNKISGLEILYELHRIIPANLYLNNLSYEEDNQIILHGQSLERNSVFEFATVLEKSPVFKGFDIKVRYATKKKSQSGEIVDFEITCIK